MIKHVSSWVESNMSKSSVTVISYDKLVSDYKNELQKFVTAINFPVKQESIDCLLHNTMTAHQRNKEKGENPYTHHQEEMIQSAITSLKQVWLKYNINYQEWKW